CVPGCCPLSLLSLPLFFPISPSFLFFSFLFSVPHSLRLCQTIVLVQISNPSFVPIYAIYVNYFYKSCRCARTHTHTHTHTHTRAHTRAHMRTHTHTHTHVHTHT